MNNTKVINFFYKGKKDEFKCARQIYLINETDKYFQGFDFGKLTPNERKIIRKTFKNHPIINEFLNASNSISNVKQNSEITNLIKKSWRTFKKENLRKKSNEVFTTEHLKIIFKRLGSEKAIRTGLKRTLKSFNIKSTEKGDYKIYKNYKGFDIIEKPDMYYVIKINNHKYFNFNKN